MRVTPQSIGLHVHCARGQNKLIRITNEETSFYDLNFPQSSDTTIDNLPQPSTQFKQALRREINNNNNRFYFHR